MLTNSILTSLPNLFGLPVESLNAAMFGLGDLAVDIGQNLGTINEDIMQIVAGWTGQLPDLTEAMATLNPPTAE